MWCILESLVRAGAVFSSSHPKCGLFRICKEFRKKKSKCWCDCDGWIVMFGVDHGCIHHPLPRGGLRGFELQGNKVSCHFTEDRHSLAAGSILCRWYGWRILAVAMHGLVTSLVCVWFNLDPHTPLHWYAIHVHTSEQFNFAFSLKCCDCLCLTLL